MAEQGEDHGVAVRPAAGTEISQQEKLKLVEDALKRPMTVGDTWYIVSRRWFQRWKKAMTGEEDKEGRVEEAQLGPVDNTPLCGSNGEVTSSLVDHVDCEFVPEDVWKLFEQWCVHFPTVVT